MKNSKTEEKTKSFDTVKTFREIKNKISEETFGMNIDDFKKYLNKKSSEFQKEQKALSANSGSYVKQLKLLTTLSKGFICFFFD